MTSPAAYSRVQNNLLGVNGFGNILIFKCIVSAFCYWLDLSYSHELLQLVALSGFCIFDEDIVAKKPMMPP